MDDTVPLLVAPRPLLLCSATEDEYSQDAPVVAAAAAEAYRLAGARDALSHARFEGGHALEEERFGVIVDWVSAQAERWDTQSPGDPSLPAG